MTTSTKAAPIRTEEQAIAYLAATGRESILETNLTADGRLRFPNPCGRCGGSGWGSWYQDGGRCYECGGVDTRNRAKTVTIKSFAQGEKRRDRAAAKRVEDRAAAKAEKVEAADAFLAARPELAAAFKVEGNSLLEDLAYRLREWGSLSDAQVALAIKVADRETERASEKKVAVPETSDRVAVEGIVISEKEHESQYGFAIKLTIKVETADGIFLLWGTAPRALLDAVSEEYRVAFDDWNNEEDLDNLGAKPERDDFSLRGRTVRFAAKISRSDRDESFGFFNRPTKAEIVPAASSASAAA